MKFREAKVTNFKRFTDLTVTGVPDTARLIMLAGPNGSGKSSFFDALKLWQTMQTLGINVSSNQYRDYYGKVYRHGISTIDLNKINVSFHPGSEPQDPRKYIYVRTAYRNDPDFRIDRMYQNANSLLEIQGHKRMIDNESVVGQNYQWLVGQALEYAFEVMDPASSIADFREQIIGDIKEPIARLFDDLELLGLANPQRDSTFRFNRGESKGFPYKNLSGGQKAAFDLVLDFCVVRREFDDTLFCIDEPEMHLSTRLQATLLTTLYEITPVNCQLMLATHSIGMMRQAMDIEKNDPGRVVFLDFGDRNFDAPEVIEPASPNRRFWQIAYAVALDDLAALVAPKHIIICEGELITTQSGRNHGHDAECYNAIFGDTYPDTRFVSMGSDQQIIGDKRGLAEALRLLISGVTVTQLIDRDDRTTGTAAQMRQDGICVLSRRNLESYLYDDEVITALAKSVEQPDKIAALLQAKRQACASTTGAPDNLKLAAGQIYNDCKRILSLTQRGNDAREFARQTLAPLIKPGMTVYDDLERDIFRAQ